MIRGYVSSDEDEEDNFYSDPVIRRTESPQIPQIRTKEMRDEVVSAMELSKKITLFFNSIEEDYFGDKLPLLKTLLSLGVPIDGSINTKEWTPLMKAGSLGKFEVVQFLLEEGADPNLHRELFTPLMACCTETYISEDLKLRCVNQLLQHGANVNEKDKYHTTALMYATGSQYMSIVEAFLSSPGVNVNIQDKEGSTALFYAVVNNNLKLVKMLIDAGTDLTICDKYGRKALDVALFKEFHNVARLFGYSEPVNNCEFLPKKRNLISDALNELPSSSGDGGFWGDVKLILESVVPFHPVENNNISLPEFLNSTESDLTNMGLLFEYDRLKFLKYTIHKFHLTPWKHSSMPQVSSDDLNIHHVVAIMSAILKHLTIINASLKYLKNRISRRSNREKNDWNSENCLLHKLTTIHSTVENLKFKLKKILKHSLQVEVCYPEDYIESSSKCKKQVNSIYQRKTCFAVFLALSSCLLYSLKPHIKIPNLLL